MKLVALLLLCTSIALAAIACTESVAPTNSPAPVAGAPAASPAAPADPLAAARLNYAKNCADCHGPSGDGGVVKLDGKEIKIPSLKADHAVKRTDERIVKMITDGDDEMPPFGGKLKPEEINDLVKFVRKEFQGK